ncbi:hypothetical protein MML48_4g00007172 [Holotrichia oblita]|uniref:Uncharacterized protein n=1 Tax=Holotrichia oblita TaxID=644536 RepID=A0ACB9T741_HOLOL|nr:hypothetical protein MML48_4g00007172 [Holotrichia oblita]
MISIDDLSKQISSAFTEDVLYNILKKESGLSNIVIKDIKSSSASKKGDSYLSNSTRLTIEGTGNNGSNVESNFQVHVIVKSFPRSQARVKLFRLMDFFKTEIYFYNKVWPKLYAFQKSKDLSQPYNSVPLCLASYVDGENDFIALEDLSHRGFTGLDRGTGLDLDTTLFILRNFAKFHAISVAYREQYPDEFHKLDEDLSETYFDEKFRKWYRGTMEKFNNVVKDAVKKELPSNYLKKIEEITSEDLFGNICKLLKQRTIFAAVTHGDCWPPNFLLQNDTQELAVIDYQLARVASLTTDILFLLNTCVDSTVLTKHWDLILQDYYQNFIKILEDLGTKLNITFDMFKAEIKMFGLFAFGMCNEALIWCLMDEGDVGDMDALEDETPLHEIWKIEPITDITKRKRLADYLKHLIDHVLT